MVFVHRFAIPFFPYLPAIIISPVFPNDFYKPLSLASNSVARREALSRCKPRQCQRWHFCFSFRKWDQATPGSPRYWRGGGGCQSLSLEGYGTRSRNPAYARTRNTVEVGPAGLSGAYRTGVTL